MSDRETHDIVVLQQRLLARLQELGLHDRVVSVNLAHHLAEISVLARNFSEHTLPLFLSLSRDHTDALGQLAVSIKWDLSEIQDAIADVERDLIELMNHLNPHQ